MNYVDDIKKYISDEIEVLNQLDIEAINTVMNIFDEAFENESMIYVFGNGGSSATSSHYQNDFNKGISEYTDKKFRFLCLNDNIPTMMAIANDIGFEEIFRFQLKGRLKKGDLVVAISGSGNSVNILNAVKYAKEQGNIVIGITGFDGGELKELSDYNLHVPVRSMQITEDIHMFFDHLIMSIYYKYKCGKEHLK